MGTTFRPRDGAPLAVLLLALGLIAWAPSASAAPTSYYAEDPSGDQEPPLDAAYDVRYLEVNGTSEAFIITVGHGGEPERFRRSTQIAFETTQHAHLMGCSVGGRNPAQESTTSCFAESYPRETPTNVAVGEDYSDRVRFEVEGGKLRFHLDADALGETSKVRMESIIVQVHAMVGADAPGSHLETALLEADTFQPEGTVLLGPPETDPAPVEETTEAPPQETLLEHDAAPGPASPRVQASPGFASPLLAAALGATVVVLRRGQA